MRRHLASSSAFFIRFAAILIAACALTSVAGAQSSTTADRKDTIAAFGAGSRVYTDYTKIDPGFTLGGDLTRNWRKVAPSLELRYLHSSSDIVHENSFLGGVKAAKGFRRFHPYGDLLLGYGNIYFVSNVRNYTHDNSTVFDVGGGLDYSVSPHVSVKVDLQQQFWRLGSEQHELEPVNANIGIVYRIPFGWGRGKEY